MATRANPDSNSSSGKWYYKLWFVLAMLIAVGPFGFPLLWKSKEFGIKAKWILTIFFIFVTIVAIWGSVETFKLVLHHIQELQAALEL